MATKRRPYTLDEERLVIQYIVKEDGYERVKGRSLWQEMESAAILNRTWQSVSEHYRKKIISRLYQFPELTKKQRFRLLKGAGRYQQAKDMNMEEGRLLSDFTESDDDRQQKQDKRQLSKNKRQLSFTEKEGTSEVKRQTNTIIKYFGEKVDETRTQETLCEKSEDDNQVEISPTKEKTFTNMNSTTLSIFFKDVVLSLMGEFDSKIKEQIDNNNTSDTVESFDLSQVKSYFDALSSAFTENLSTTVFERFCSTHRTMEDTN